MAFPTIQTADTKNGTVTSNSTTWTLTYPTNIAADDLLLAFAAVDGNFGGGDPTWPAGWLATAFPPTGAVCYMVAKKKAAGSETGTFNVTGMPSEQGGWRIFRITGWEGTIGTDVGNITNAGAVVWADQTSGFPSNTPNPPSCDPANWDVEDTLWFAMCAVDTSRTISVYPLADNNTADVSGGAGGATLGICTENNAVASNDPGTFTASASDDWRAITVAVRPAAAGGSTYTKAGYGKEHG